MKSYSLTLVLLWLLVPLRAEEKPLLPNTKRIVFLGDSITYGGEYIEFIEAYFVTRFPERQVEFLNLGLPSETVSGLSEEGHAGGAFPRPVLSERIDRVLAKTHPDLLVACYGMNDGIYLPFDEARFAKFQEGIKSLRDKAAAAKISVLHVTPPTFDEVKGGHPGYSNTLGRYSDWLLAQRKSGWDVVDLHGPMDRYLAERRKQSPNFAYAGDGVHANTAGNWIIAKQILLHLGAKDLEETESAREMLTTHPSGGKLLALIQQRQRTLKDAWLTATGHKRPGMNKGLPLADAQANAAELEKQIRALALPAGPASFPGKRSDYHGFDRYGFKVDDCDAIVVVPKQAAAGNPWIWRAAFFDHRPETDLALLAKGFHLVYIQVGNTFGCPDAMAHWEVFYKELTEKHALSKKPALEGLSRGGLYVFNWAAAHLDRVGCIIGDNAVCDFKSWPGGKGKGKGSPGDWEKLIQDYHFASETEALAYPKNPIDNLAPLAHAHIPLFLLCADADDVVPYLENGAIVKERYEKLGGPITLLIKKGMGHHPHGLDDPTPIVDFVLQHSLK